MKKVSRQRAWQLRQRELGHCVLCGRLAALTVRRNAKHARCIHCDDHKARYSQWQKDRRLKIEMQKAKSAGRRKPAKQQLTGRGNA